MWNAEGSELGGRSFDHGMHFYGAFSLLPSLWVGFVKWRGRLG